MNDLLSIKQASEWASQYLKKNVTTSNISYLINYGRIEKNGDNSSPMISKDELIKYYKSFYGRREIDWTSQLGKDLNWGLSFDWLKEKDTTKHVHRLHPYKGKFIPQLVEYFLDDHVDEFKRQVFFNSDDIVLDPFCGSGTTLVQANELGIHAVGIDISAFNTFISNAKLLKFDITDFYSELKTILNVLKGFISDNKHLRFEEELLSELNEFNKKHFPSPDFKIKVRKGLINENEYGYAKENEFLPVFNKLVEKYNLKVVQDKTDTFLGKWYLQPVKDEVEIVFDLVKKIQNLTTKQIISLVLSRTIRSCRATTHADLATLVNPVTKTYYCAKHGKICKPLFSILSWFERYSKDTITRYQDFERLKTNTHQLCITADSRNVDIVAELERRNLSFASNIKKKKIKGIFSSPPYVGLIDYHEQHAYAYDLFGFNRNDDLEIGAMRKGKTKQAKEDYIDGISRVLINSKKFLAEDYNVFLVANDRNNLYPSIADNSGMKIINRFKRPVLNRTEKDKAAYSEIIFHLIEK